MPYKPDRLAHFRTLTAMRAPRVASAVAWMLVLGIAIAAAPAMPSTSIHATADATRGARIAASVGKCAMRSGL